MGRSVTARYRLLKAIPALRPLPVSRFGDATIEISHASFTVKSVYSGMCAGAMAEFCVFGKES